MQRIFGLFDSAINRGNFRHLQNLYHLTNLRFDELSSGFRHTINNPPVFGYILTVTADLGYHVGLEHQSPTI